MPTTPIFSTKIAYNPHIAKLINSKNLPQFILYKTAHGAHITKITVAKTFQINLKNRNKQPGHIEQLPDIKQPFPQLTIQRNQHQDRINIRIV